MKINWTDGQKEAINTRSENIIVSAAAGSGKTAVLTQRIIDLIEEGLDISNLLVITFTNASARGMKEKIRKKLYEKAKKSKDKRYFDQLEKLGTSDISTVHSFCSRIIRDNFHVLEIDPRYRIGSSSEIDIIKSDILNQIMEEEYKKGEKEFIYLVEAFGNYRSDNSLRKLIDKTDIFLSSKPDRKSLERAIKENYKDKDFWKKEFEEFILNIKEKAIKDIDKILELSSDKKVVDFFIEEKKQIKELSPFINFKFRRIISLKNELNEVNIRKTRDAMKKDISQMAKIFTGHDDFESLFESFSKEIIYIDKLISISNIYHKAVMDKKKEEGVLFFNDLEELALVALSKSEVRNHYQNKYNHILVDEYQDINEIQEEIIKSVSRENNLFMVGDVKQSIYRFRQAEPKIFTEKYHLYRKGYQFSRAIDLNSNFRSSKAIIDSVNNIFENTMRKDFGGVEYDDKQKLIFGGVEDLEYKKPEILITLRTKEPKYKKELESIASKIRALIKEGYKYSDIAILARSPASYSNYINEVFDLAAIPVFLESTQEYLESLEVELMINSIKLIDNYKQDIPLLSVIRLDIFNFSNQEIYKIREFSKDKRYFHESFNYYRENGENKTLVKKIDDFFLIIDELKLSSRYLSLHELISKIYSQLGIEEILLYMSSSSQRIYNIRLLIEKAREFENTLLVGLSSFLEYIDRLKERKIDFETTKLASEALNSVRFMSIHKSKGLEFEVVIVAGLDKKYNEQDYRDNYFLGENMIFLDSFDISKKIRLKHGFRKITEILSSYKDRQEEARLLYVAMTRAKKRLILSASVDEIADNNIYNISLNELNSIKDYFSLIIPKLNINNGIIKSDYFEIANIDSIEKKQKKKSEVILSNKIYKRREFEISSKRNKYSVTSLSKTTIDEKDVEAMDRGTSFHKVLEWIDIDRIKKGSSILDEVNKLEEKGLINEFRDIKLIENIFNSSIGKRILKSDEILRETPFVSKVIVDNEEIFVQGKIDLVFKENDNYFILDYKSDHNMKRLESYKEQIEIYASAIEKITSWNIASKYIYYARLDKLIEI